MAAAAVKVGAGVSLVLRDVLFVDLVRKGHLKLGAGAKIIVVPSDAPEDFLREVRRLVGAEG